VDDIRVWAAYMAHWYTWLIGIHSNMAHWYIGLIRGRISIYRESRDAHHFRGSNSQK